MREGEEGREERRKGKNDDKREKEGEREREKEENGKGMKRSAPKKLPFPYLMKVIFTLMFFFHNFTQVYLGPQISLSPK